MEKFKDIFDFSALMKKAYHLEAIHAAPQETWPALVEAAGLVSQAVSQACRDMSQRVASAATDETPCKSMIYPRLSQCRKCRKGSAVQMRRPARASRPASSFSARVTSYPFGASAFAFS